MKTKTLCIFSPAFPDKAEPGWLPPVQVFIKALNRNFPQLKLVIFAFQYPYSTSPYTWEGNMVIPFNGMHKDKVARLLMWLRIARRFYAVQKTENIIGILSLWCGECAFMAQYLAKLFSIKHRCWILGQDARALNPYVKRIKPKPGMLAAISDFVREEFYRNHHVLPEHVVTNGIDTAMFDEMPAAKDIDVIGLGSMSFLKQYNLFVEIIAQIKKSLPGIKAMLCGDGEAMEQLKALIQANALTSNIELTGTLQQYQGLKMMQRAKILLHPSSYEGFSTACLEALFAGAHVVSFCKPMRHDIPHWHIVTSKEEMLQKVFDLLATPGIPFTPVLAYSIDDSAKQMMRLFDYP
ncbi:glycosyltransferase family 4 protein [Foetidibacter luteolus]|uniref:glycosyltransferase family 4 protein n=1 Tax=Foetidibacter luteolus TaxID=2608880 RepID=UPI00129B1195|nr:glycosyltransferase family 4 protein [Foetidibacter luteolus]